MIAPPVWLETPLKQLDRGQWESLCDGCAKCCLHKVEDDRNGEVYYTQVACRLLDLETCSCIDYPNRQQRVEDCVCLEAGQTPEVDWLPSTCAYRLRAAGKGLPRWHPLLSGDPESVHEAGVSIRAWAVSELQLDSLDGLEDFVIDADL